MKHLLTILCVLTSFTALAQFPNTHTQSNPYTKEVFNGSVNPKKGLINGRYADTAAANLDYIAHEPGGQIVVGNTIYLRDTTLTKWIVAGGIGATSSTITILNDSSISICNLNFCDTFKFTNIVVNNFSVVNDSTILVCDGNNVCDTLFIPPTPISKNFVDSTKIRGGDSLFYYINGNEYLGGIMSPKSNISIANDSSLVICSSNKCDTFIFNDIIINSFTVVNDSTILVCDGNNICDTLHITPTPLAKSYVDSVKVDGSLIYYYINGNANLAGVVGGKDGLISGGIVTWSGQGLKFYVSPATYVISSIYYHSGLDSVTLATAPTLDSRIDLIGVDTTGHAFATTGTPSTTPIVPQPDITSQIALTTGILLNANDTVPSNVTTRTIYDENLGSPSEWATGTQGTAMTINFGSTVNPKHGTKDAYISSYGNGSTFYFSTSTADIITADETLTAWIYLSSPYTSNYLYVQFYDNTSGATAQIRLTANNGFNPNLVGQYQLITIPFYSLSWTNYTGKFNTVLFKLYGTGTNIYADNISLQKGINSIPPPTDYSNKLDSVLLRNDSLFQYIKGVKTFKGLASGSGVGGGITKLGDSPYGLIKLNDSTYLVDSTLLLTQLMAATTYLNIVDTTDKWIPVGSKFPIGVIKPILALNDSTLAFDSLNLTEIRYSQAARDTATWTDTTLIDKKYFLDRLAAYSPGSGTDTTSLSNRINAKQDALTVTTVGASGASTLINDTLNIPQYSGGTDSASVHVGHITVVGDTAIVFTDLRGNSDTIAISLLQYWKKNGNKLYYNGGNVGLGTDTASAKFTIRKDIVNETDIADSMGIMLANLDTSSVVGKTSPPITFRSYGNSPSTGFYDTRVRLRGKGVTGSNTLPFFYIDGSKDGGKTWTTMFTLTNAGGITVPGGIIMGSLTATFGTMTSVLTVNGIVDNSTLSVAKQAVIGSGTYNDYSASLQMASTQQGLLPPKVTTAQRDSINLVITSVTVTSGGSYTGTPTLNAFTAPTSLTNKSAILTAVKTGSAITSVTVTDGGSFAQTPQIQIIGGTGSGAVLKANMTQVLTAGVTVYNTDINALQTWNGNKWVTSGTITGTATLASGTVTVTAPSVLSTSKIFVSYNTPSGTQGFLSAPTGSITSGTSFVINSSSSSDNSTVNWSIIN